jgi:hypothetical protein
VTKDDDPTTDHADVADWFALLARWYQLRQRTGLQAGGVRQLVGRRDYPNAARILEQLEAAEDGRAIDRLARIR